MFKITKLTVGLLETNCYIIYEDNHAIVIDPGAEGKRITDFLQKKKLIPKYIINTHGHLDHIGANRYLKEQYPNTHLAIHYLDEELLYAKQEFLSLLLFGTFKPSPKPDILLKENDEIKLENTHFKVIHTPGHTKGSISLYNKEIILTGDTLFCNGVGRYDIPGANKNDLFNSIKEKIFILDSNLIVYPGHGETTTIEKEKKDNPFFK